MRREEDIFKRASVVPGRDTCVANQLVRRNDKRGGLIHVVLLVAERLAHSHRKLRDFLAI